MSLIDAGEHRLKDLGEPTRIYRLMVDGADDPRRLRTLERAPHNLPLQLSSFIGRQGHITEVTDLVRHSRLVTLTGIGGVGKTRLSLQVAAELLDEFDHGAWFIELAPLTEASFLADTIASALSVPQDPTVTAEGRLMRFLPDRRALLVVDNCEHLIDDVATLIDSILRSCPDVHVLATSREGLAVSGEVLWRVPSLRVDDDAAAVELFADRARLVQPNFAVTGENIAAVVDLCARLDGIPLAIELATARLKMLSLDQIAQHLNDRFRLLTGGSRTAVERQRTLRAMMDWSYDLLSDQERALLRRLSVFSDGFTYEAAEEVCSGETLAGFEVLDLLGRLVEASVVTFDADPRPRYRLLETVRQYALDKLVDAEEADEARLRHAEHFRTTSKRTDASVLDGNLQVIAIATDDLANFRGAMTFASEAGQGPLALELACNLRSYFWNRMMFRESLNWLTSALDRVADDASPLVAAGTAYALTEANNMGDGALILSLAARARRILAISTDDLTRGLLANSLASLEMFTNVSRADELLAEATTLLRNAEDPRWKAPLQNRYLSAWLMNSRESEQEILSLLDDPIGATAHARVGRTMFKVLAEEYEDVIASTETLDPLDEWENVMMLLYRMHARERPDARRPPWSQSRGSLGCPVRSPMGGRDGTLGWHTSNSVTSMQPSRASSRRAHSTRTCRTRTTGGNVAWFWSLVATRRGDYEAAAVLLGSAAATFENASMSLLAFDQRLVEESRTAVRGALGETLYGELLEKGATIAWEDLPLVHQQGPRTVTR
ncbi:MAG TPA: NB-ARC domain-containing protein [Acidimicrobiia bacterium]|nr:NB-ARC domain-containing protein [Acidimicrobiia bacterium]